MFTRFNYIMTQRSEVLAKYMSDGTGKHINVSLRLLVSKTGFT